MKIQYYYSVSRKQHGFSHYQIFLHEGVKFLGINIPYGKKYALSYSVIHKGFLFMDDNLEKSDAYCFTNSHQASFIALDLFKRLERKRNRRITDFSLMLSDRQLQDTYDLIFNVEATVMEVEPDYPIVYYDNMREGVWILNNDLSMKRLGKLSVPKLGEVKDYIFFEEAENPENLKDNTLLVVNYGHWHKLFKKKANSWFLLGNLTEIYQKINIDYKDEFITLASLYSKVKVG